MVTKYGNHTLPNMETRWLPNPYGNHIWLLYCMCCAVQNAKNKHGLPNWQSCDLLLSTCLLICQHGLEKAVPAVTFIHMAVLKISS